MRAGLKLIAVIWSCLMASTLWAADRIALVVGNSGYASVTPLDNPSNDARLISQTLEGLGFTVTVLIDASQSDMKRAISRFGRDLRQAGQDATGLFYYAGHGVQSFGNNYLLPVDVELYDAADLDLVGVEAQSVLRQMYSARNKTNIVILDACRNNPFSAIPDFADNGLAEMQAPTGTFLAYATAPGEVALDGTGSNSPFTRSLVAMMPTPGMPIEQVFKQVRVDVLKETGGVQTPWDASSLTTDFAFAEAKRLSPKDLEAQQFWNSVRESRDAVQLMLFLRGYGDSAYAGEARALLSEVMEQELNGANTGQAAVSPAPPDAERRMFETVRADGSAAAYEAYLQTYPAGAFAEIAQQELAALRDGTGHDPVGEGVSAEPAQTTAAPAAPAKPAEPVTFSGLLSADLPEVDGFSISDLIVGTPLFPPIEGLPDELWKGQSCSNCHEWNRERICTQAKTYVTADASRSLDKEHPFGGVLKRFLRRWAEDGCP